MNHKLLWTAFYIGLVMQLGWMGTAYSQTPGAPFGTREPRTCPPRKIAGVPSPDQARGLFICDVEKYVGGYIYLVSDVTVQIGKSRPFQTYPDTTHSDIDVSAPVYPIQGGYTAWQCTRRDAMLGQDPNRNCTRTDNPQATGTCYKNTFNEWHCAMMGAGAMNYAWQAPPTGP